MSYNLRAGYRFYWVLSIAAVLYCFIFGLKFSADFLALSPVLDARENLAWAQLIAEDNLPAEPLYRALLYPWVLAHLPGDVLFRVLFGVFLHLLNAALVGLITHSVWSCRKPAFFAAAILYAVYPVSLYFAVQTLDITLGMSLFLGAVVCFFKGQGSPRASLQILCGVLAGLSVLVRPNFLPAVLMFPVLHLVEFAFKDRSPRHFVSFVRLGLSLCLVLLLQGLWNVRQSGDFRFLPWQGAYNLYAANRDGANGQFYMQRVSFDKVPAGMNTTRMESEYLYRQAHPKDANPTVDAMSAYWREQLRAEISQDPMRWLGLMGRKIVYLFNDWEQYNNLTYVYHKARFSILRYNPLGWGLILIGATLALVLCRRSMDHQRAFACVLIALGYAAGVLLFFVSARFRLPLAPLLIVFCGGLMGVRLRQLNTRHYVFSGLVLFGVASLTFGNWFNARNESSFIQDELLLAHAASKVGADDQALKYAQSVLRRDAVRPTAKRIEVVSLFNIWIESYISGDSVLAQRYWEELEPSMQVEMVDDSATLYIRGVFAWRSGEHTKAKAYWQEAVETFDSAWSRQALRAVEIQSERGVDALPNSEPLERILFDK